MNEHELTSHAGHCFRIKMQTEVFFFFPYKIIMFLYKYLFFNIAIVEVTQLFLKVIALP